MAKQIVWKDLEKRLGLFTTRNAVMLDLDNGSKIQYYSVNTKINLVQETELDGVRYFRTESAATQNLNWAFKASDFGLPELKVASLEPSRKPSIKFSPDTKLFHTNSSNKKSSKTVKPPKSEEVISEDRKHSILSAFKRFFGRSK